MPKAFSTVGRWGLAALHSLALPGSAVSSEAQTLRQAVRAVVDRVERSQSLFGGKGVAISQIWALANECSQPKWDGESAIPTVRYVRERHRVDYGKAHSDEYRLETWGEVDD